MSMSTLMALDRLPGHLDGYGAITAELAEAIMNCAASLNLAIIDPSTGHPLHASSHQYYRPRQHHRDIVGTITETCRFPSCRQPTWKCDLDHRTPFDHQHPDNGGPTDPCNLDPLCRRHHLMKHHSTWTQQRQPDGTMTWRSPTGHTYTDPPREITLPGELLTPTPTPRTTIGLADTEHRNRCTTTHLEPPDDKVAEQAEQDTRSRSYTIRLADREDTRQRVLHRLANLRRLQNTADDNAARPGHTSGTATTTWSANPGATTRASPRPSPANTGRNTSGTATTTSPTNTGRNTSGTSTTTSPANPGSNDQRPGTPASSPTNTRPTNTRPTNRGRPTAADQRADLQHAKEHPAWTLTNIPTTVAELRARSGFTTTLADDDPPPF